MSVVVGGGIAGLSNAWYLSKFRKVTLIESGALGGWIQTQRTPNILELGPRTLRPSGISGANTLDLIYQLGLKDEVITVPKNHPSARNRFILYQDKLHIIPRSIKELVFNDSPLLKGVISRSLVEPFQPAHNDYESIDSFVTRRFGPALSNNLVSAIIHGIYAGDHTKLEIQSALPSLSKFEKKAGVLIGMLTSKSEPIKASSDEALEFIKSIQTQSVYSFKVETKDGFKMFSGHISACLPSKELSKIVGGNLSKLLSQIKSVTVAVVNLVYRGSPMELSGFGYLVPASEMDKSNVIGVVFDSCAMPEQETQPVTRLTAMMGGHLFKRFGEPETVDKKKLLDLALEDIEKRLNVPRNLLVESFVSIHKDCIPQYHVGHQQLLNEIENELGSCPNLSLLGSSYNGVSINDVIQNSKKKAFEILGTR